MWAIDGEKCGVNCLQAFWTWAYAVYPHKTVKLVLYLLECQDFERTHCCCSGSLWVMEFFSHSTPKEVFVSSGQNYHHEIAAYRRLCWNKSRVPVFSFL